MGALPEDKNLEELNEQLEEEIENMKAKVNIWRVGKSSVPYSAPVALSLSRLHPQRQTFSTSLRPLRAQHEWRPGMEETGWNSNMPILAAAAHCH